LKAVSIHVAVKLLNGTLMCVWYWFCRLIDHSRQQKYCRHSPTSVCRLPAWTSDRTSA